MRFGAPFASICPSRKWVKVHGSCGGGYALERRDLILLHHMRKCAKVLYHTRPESGPP